MVTISRKEIVRKFRALGYAGPFSGGKHQFMVKGRQKLRIPNSHGSGDVHISLIREILRQAGISVDEWEKA